MDKIGIGLIGIGAWGQNLLRNFYQLGVLRAACDIHGDVEKKVADLTPDVPFYTDPDKILCDPGIGAIVIATPAVDHARMAEQAILAGKDVFVEKPLAINIADGIKLVELAERCGKILMVGHVLNYHPVFVKLKEVVDSGELGKIRYIYSNRLNIGKIRTEENILWSFAPHDVSILLSLLREMPSQLSCQGGCYVNESIFDVTMTQMVFPSGVRGHIYVSWLHPFKEQRLVIVGSEKMAVMDDTSADKLKLYPHSVKWKDRTPTAIKAEAEIIDTDNIEPLTSECTHFLECISSRKAPRTDGREGLRVLTVLDACQKSLNQNGIPVMLGNIDFLNKPYFKHESAYVDDPVDIGVNTKIWHFSHVLKGARIGTNCILGQNVNIGSKAIIGNNVKIQNNVSVYDEVILEDYVFCGPSMVFTNVINPRSEINRKDEYKRTLVKKGATLGANCTIVCGNTIGEYSLIGAGSVVTHDVPPYAIMAGVPAIHIGWICRCGIRLQFDGEWAECTTCKQKYHKIGKKRIEAVVS